jgi:hypothetical protein
VPGADEERRADGADAEDDGPATRHSPMTMAMHVMALVGNR